MISSGLEPSRGRGHIFGLFILYASNIIIAIYKKPDIKITLLKNPKIDKARANLYNCVNNNYYLIIFGSPTYSLQKAIHRRLTVISVNIDSNCNNKEMSENVVQPGIQPGSPGYRSDCFTTRPLNQPDIDREIARTQK